MTSFSSASASASSALASFNIPLASIQGTPQHILIHQKQYFLGIDFSPSTAHALAWLTETCLKSGDILHLVHCRTQAPRHPAWMERTRNQLQAFVGVHAPHLVSDHSSIRLVYHVGASPRPHRYLLRAIHRLDVDMVVLGASKAVGSPGRICQKVLRQSPAPVTVVRDPMLRALAGMPAPQSARGKTEYGVQSAEKRREEGMVDSGFDDVPVTPPRMQRS